MTACKRSGTAGNQTAVNLYPMTDQKYPADSRSRRIPVSRQRNAGLSASHASMGSQRDTLRVTYRLSILLQSPAIAEDCYILVVLFFYFYFYFFFRPPNFRHPWANFRETLPHDAVCAEIVYLL